MKIHSFYEKEDCLLAEGMHSFSFIGELTEETAVKRNAVNVPSAEFSFMHESAIIEHNGTLYASWYANKKTELNGYTPILESRSYDGGKSWTKPKIVVEDTSGKILYCPPVYAKYKGDLYLFINEMVSADFMHSLDLYKLNPASGEFEFVWSRPIPFKINTNAVSLANGKLMLPGRIAEMDSFPNTPAVLICDSGNPEDEWRLVKIRENGDLPDGEKLVHPELTVICLDNKIFAFCRNDKRRVPLVFVSEDFGEHWSDYASCDIPFINSKLYAGSLSDGRHFMATNIDNLHRRRLVLFLTEDSELKFTKKYVLFDKEEKPIEDAPLIVASHYPSVCEADGKLHIIATTQYVYPDGAHKRGAYLYTVDLT